MNSTRIWKIAFFASLAVNFLLCLLLSTVLGVAVASEEKFNSLLVFASAAFILLYFAAFGAHLRYARSGETRPALVLSIIFSIAQLVCLLLMGALLLTSNAPRDDETMFSVTPIKWIQQRLYIPLFFAAAFLPAQLVILHRFFCESAEQTLSVISDGAGPRKSTPYHAEKIRISKLGTSV